MKTMPARRVTSALAALHAFAVTDAGGSATSTGGCSYVLPRPVITSASKLSHAGDTVTVTGMNLTGTSSITFDGRTQSITSVTDTMVTFTADAVVVSGSLMPTTRGGTATGVALRVL